MTNREYFNQKSEVFFDKLFTLLKKYLKPLYSFCLVLEVLLFIAVLKVDSIFMLLFIPSTIFCIEFTSIMVELWLDKEHKEIEGETIL